MSLSLTQKTGNSGQIGLEFVVPELFDRLRELMVKEGGSVGFMTFAQQKRLYFETLNLERQYKYQTPVLFRLSTVYLQKNGDAFVFIDKGRTINTTKTNNSFRVWKI